MPLLLIQWKGDNIPDKGFLPGFNFPRLPVRAYIPATSGGEFVNRPRTFDYSFFSPLFVMPKHRRVGR